MLRGTEARLQRNASLVREIVLTFVGAGIQTIYSLDLIRQFDQSTLNGSPSLQLGGSLFIVGYVTITVSYSLIASLSFSPKRLINPVWIQLLTLVFSSLIVAESLSATSSFALAQYLTVYHFTLSTVVGAFGFLYGMTVGVLGFVQWLFVRLLVGLNGTESDLDINTFEYDQDFKGIAGALKKADVRTVGNLLIRTETSNLLLLSNFPLGTGDKLVVCASPKPDDPSKTVVSTVAFNASNFAVRQATSSSAWMKSMRLYLEDAIGKKGEKITGESVAQSAAVSFALRRTVASIGGIRELPKYHVLAMGLTVALGVGFTFAHFVWKFIDQPTYLDALVLLFVALVVELGPAMAESVYKKREAQATS